MATWRDYDTLETAISRVGGELAGVLELARDRFGLDNGDPAVAALAEAGKELTDRTRELRQQVHARLVDERGYRP